MKGKRGTYHIKSIREHHEVLGLSRPKHPLVSVFDFSEVDLPNIPVREYQRQTFGFYAIALINDVTGHLRYGQGYCDFDAGMVTFSAPNQIMSPLERNNRLDKGLCLLFHPDFLAGHPLARNIKNYGFFSYEIREALYLSDQEEEILRTIVKGVEREHQNTIDKFSQDIILAQIELLLQFGNRFYNRQFLTRKMVNNEIVIRLEHLLNDYFNDDEKLSLGLPKVQSIASQLGVSVDYLSDMLRTVTGMNTQQHIHGKLIEKAKELLSTTDLSVKEIAFQLGYDYPQSFNKLFKKKTAISPLDFRNSFY